MKIKEIEQIVSENIKQRQEQIGRKFMEKEKAISILVEQLKLMEFDPAYFWQTRTENDIHEETLEKLSKVQKNGGISVDDIGEIDVNKQSTCKILAIVYKYIADKVGLYVTIEGRETEINEPWKYDDYSKLLFSAKEEHFYNVVHLMKSLEEIVIDPQDEAQVIKIKARTRNLGQREMGSDNLYIQEKETIDKILEAVGYIKPGEEYTNDYAKRLINKLKNEDMNLTEYEQIKEFLKDKTIRERLKNSGVVASYVFLTQNIDKITRLKNEFQENCYFLPCYMKKDKNGKVQLRHSYFIYVKNGDSSEIYMYSNTQGEIVEVSPKLVEKMLDNGLILGRGEKVNVDEITKQGMQELTNYVYNSSYDYGDKTVEEISINDIDNALGLDD